MLECVKNYGDSVARENIFALTPLPWLFLRPDQCSYNDLKSSVCFVIVTASHEHYPRIGSLPLGSVQCELCPPVKFSSSRHGSWCVCYPLLFCMVELPKAIQISFLIKGKSTKSDIMYSVFFCDIRRSRVFLWRIAVHLVLAQKTCFSPEGRTVHARKGT